MARQSVLTQIKLNDPTLAQKRVRLGGLCGDDGWRCGAEVPPPNSSRFRAGRVMTACAMQHVLMDRLGTATGEACGWLEGSRPQCDASVRCSDEPE